MVSQYLGWNATMGGGLFLLTGIKSGSPQLINILRTSRVAGGRLNGQSLDGGAFMSPDLSYDGTKVLFAWTNSIDKCWHIFKVNIDGSGLVQLTDGSAPYAGLQGSGADYSVRLPDQSHNDFDPCWLPDGRIVFVTERRGGYQRCTDNNPLTNYTLFSMKDDGSDIIPISYHETNEWHPSVNNDGMIVYTRWDYIDRDDCIAHHLWTCYPDGRDPRAPHGNYPNPQTTMQGANWADGRRARPDGEWNIRAIPNSNKYVATASGHHTQSFGQIILIDPSVRDDNAMAQVRGITTNITNWPDADGPYATAWPLSEQYFICNKDNAIILLDAQGNQQTIYQTTQAWRPLDPIPVRPRPKPPVPTRGAWQGERANLADHFRATISIVNVRYGDLPLPAGVTIKSLRIMQVIPKATPFINVPRAGYPSESLCRLSLGTVPVEADGSVYCEAPVGKEIYFQLLDDKGLAVQSMRSGTYVHAGEQLSCMGCHEDKWTAIPTGTIPLASRRNPSKLLPEPGAEPGGITPINYYRLVKPVFDRTCVPCHAKQAWAPTNMSYASVGGLAFFFCGTGTPYLNGDILTPTRGGSRTIPGMFGARYSRMGKKMLEPAHQSAIPAEDFARVSLWLDGNSNELSSLQQVDQQRQGIFVWPDMDVDPKNPTGVESDRPLPGTQTSLTSPRLGPPPEQGTIRVRGNAVVISRNLIGSLVVLDLKGRIVCAARPMPPDAMTAVQVPGPGVYLVRMSSRAEGAAGDTRIVVR